MNLPDDYFMDTDEPMLTYLEEKSLKAIEELNTSNTNNRQRAEKTVNYLLLGMGSLALLIINKPEALQTLALKLGVYILLVGWSFAILALIINVLSSAKRALLGNSPEKLYNESFKEADDPMKLMSLRQMELRNYSETIRELEALNKRFQKWTDGSMYIAAATPLLAMIISLYYFE